MALYCYTPVICARVVSANAAVKASLSMVREQERKASDQTSDVEESQARLVFDAWIQASVLIVLFHVQAVDRTLCWNLKFSVHFFFDIVSVQIYISKKKKTKNQSPSQMTQIQLTVAGVSGGNRPDSLWSFSVLVL